jgi:hypothetical protein
MPGRSRPAVLCGGIFGLSRRAGEAETDPCGLLTPSPGLALPVAVLVYPTPILHRVAGSVASRPNRAHDGEAAACKQSCHR